MLNKMFSVCIFSLVRTLFVDAELISCFVGLFSIMSRWFSLIIVTWPLLSQVFAFITLIVGEFLCEAFFLLFRRLWIALSSDRLASGSGKFELYIYFRSVNLI